MKVTLINHSDIVGGASVVSLRLLEALRREGVDARMVVKRISGQPNQAVAELGYGLRAKLAFYGERARIFLANGLRRSTLFKVSTADRGLPVVNHPWVKDADIIALNWFNQGMLSLKELQRICALGKPVVWTMHDMWAMTGICHHAGSCENYRSRCGRCPLLGWPHRNFDLSTKIFLRKKKIYQDSKINFVAVSHWLAECASKSALLADQHVEVIHNAFPFDRYSTTPRRSRAELGLPDDRSKLIAMCAARLDDSIKDLPAAIDAFNAYDGATPITAVFCGDIRRPELFNRLRIPYVHLGNITDQARLADIYSHCTAVVSSSKFESLPSTLIEGLASGAYAIGFGGDGREEIIDHLSTGYIARKGCAADLAKGIAWAVSAPTERERLRQMAKLKFASEAIAQQYINLFQRLLSDR